MQDHLFETLYSEWKEELGIPLYESQSFYIALFSPENKLLLANKSMMNLFCVGEPFKCLCNPTMEKLRSIPTEETRIYDGFLTIGDQVNHFTSIQAKVFSKNNQILIVGSVDASMMVEQNQAMHRLNDEISALQRQLIKEKFIIEKTSEQLNWANTQLQESNATKDTFLSIMAHDLKNPFNVLLGFSDLLLENYAQFDNQEIMEQIEVIHQTVHKTYHLLEDLLLWSRSQLGRIAFEPVTVHLEEIGKGVSYSLLELANQKNVRMEVDIPKDLTALSDVNMLKTILRNLITNAIKFSWRDGIVRLFAVSDQQTITVSVSDQGVGIRPESQGKLWKLSEQFSTLGTDGEEGSGLGLLLCKEFAEKQGGSIGVKSEPDKGSTFYFTLPLAQTYVK